MKIIEQSNTKLVIDHQNNLSKLVFILLIITGLVMLVVYFTKEIDALLWIGLLVFTSGVIGYPFLKSINLSLDKSNQQVTLVKKSLFNKKVSTYNYNEIDNFTIKEVISSNTDNEYGAGTTTYFYIILTKVNGDLENIFVSNSQKKMQEKLNLILNYF